MQHARLPTEMSPEHGVRCEIDPCAGHAESCACGASVCSIFGLSCTGPTPTGLGCTNGSL
jgi:hypothetical protein